MIRNQQDAVLELQVVERETRFIHGMRWHLRTLLGDLELEEQMLLPTLPLETHSIDDAAPGTPKMHTLLDLDPLGTSRPSKAAELQQESSSSSCSASEPEWVGA